MLAPWSSGRGGIEFEDINYLPVVPKFAPFRQSLTPSAVAAKVYAQSSDFRDGVL
jgi:hypothetical protein